MRNLGKGLWYEGLYFVKQRAKLSCSWAWCKPGESEKSGALGEQRKRWGNQVNIWIEEN